MTRVGRGKQFAFVGLIVLATGIGLFQIDRWRRNRDSLPLVPFAATLAPGVHILGGLEPSAAYVVETSAGPVLIDSGLESDARTLKREMSKLGLDWKAVRAIFLTHVHGDHSGGAEHLREATKAKVYAGKGDSDELRAGNSRDALFATYYMPDLVLHKTTVNVELKGGEAITFGDTRFQAIATPGHTPGSICYLIERNGLRALFAGDVISMLRGDPKSHSPSAKPLGTYSAYLAPKYRGDARSYLASLRELRRIPVPNLVLPGHPRSDPTPQNPRLTQARWETMLDEGIHDMEVLVTRFNKDGRNFLDGSPKPLLPGLDYLGDLQGVAVYGFFAGSRFILVNAPGGSELLWFVKERLTRLGRKSEAPTAVMLTSCDESGTSGLKPLVEACHAAVVVSPAGLATVKELCPAGTTIYSTDEFAKKGWFPSTPKPLRGRGVAPVAYLLPWSGKNVLIAGPIPSLLDQGAAENLRAELSVSKEDPMDYLVSINGLAELKPDLWLPEIPSNGQNANIYGEYWVDLIQSNYHIAYLSLLSTR